MFVYHETADYIVDDDNFKKEVLEDAAKKNAKKAEFEKHEHVYVQIDFGAFHKVQLPQKIRRLPDYADLIKLISIGEPYDGDVSKLKAPTTIKATLHGKLFTANSGSSFNELELFIYEQPFYFLIHELEEASTDKTASGPTSAEVDPNSIETTFKGQTIKRTFEQLYDQSKIQKSVYYAYISLKTHKEGIKGIKVFPKAEIEKHPSLKDVKVHMEIVLMAVFTTRYSFVMEDQLNNEKVDDILENISFEMIHGDFTFDGEVPGVSKKTPMEFVAINNEFLEKEAKELLFDKQGLFKKMFDNGNNWMDEYRTAVLEGLGAPKEGPAMFADDVASGKKNPWGWKDILLVIGSVLLLLANILMGYILVQKLRGKKANLRILRYFRKKKNRRNKSKIVNKEKGGG